MQRIVCAGFVLSLIVAANGASADDREGWSVVNKAIEAAGGMDKLKTFQSCTIKDKGKYYGMGDGLDYTSNASIAYPDKFRMEIVGVFTVVVNGDKGWLKSNNATAEMTAEQIARQKDSSHSQWVTSLVPLADKDYKLALAGDVTAEGRPCVAVKVSRKDKQDVLLDFDKDSGLLTRARYRTWSDEMQKEVDQEIAYFDYHENSGAKLPKRVVMKRDGKLFVESTVEEHKPVEKPDDSLFAAP